MSSDINHIISGIMVNMLVLSVVDHEFESRSSQTIDYNIDICCFSVKHTSLKRKSRDWLLGYQGNVYKWTDMSTYRLLFRWASIIKIQLSVLIWYKTDIIIIISLNAITCSLHNIDEIFVHVVLSTNHSLIDVI